MKNLNTICAFLLFGAFASCKKDSNPQSIPTKPTKPIAAVRDSVSYTIDGKTYTAGGVNINNISTGAEDANRQLVFTKENGISAYALVGNPDSVMYFQKVSIFSKGTNITVFFLKKYIKQKRGTNWTPGLNDALKLFTVGKHPLAEDFEWQNAQNGIAIALGTYNAGYLSYNAYNGAGTVATPPGFQKNSSFEITSFIPTTSGNCGYNLEAKFTAVVLDATGKQKKVDNGYLRLNVGVWYNTLAN